MADHEALRRLAETQHGLVSRRQAERLGFTVRALDRAVRSGRVERLSPRVLRIVGSPFGVHQRAMASVLDTSGGLVALQSAAALWRLPGFEVEPVHVLTTRTPHRGTPHLGIVHSSTTLAEEHRTEIEGIPVTTPVRTLHDLARRLHPAKTEHLCDDMLRRGLLRLESLHDLAAGLPPRGGTRGNGVVRRLAAGRPIGWVPSESRLERRFERILEQAGEPPMERQVEIGDARGWIGRVDFADRATSVVAEVQSDLFHTGLTDRRRDAERFRRLRSAGWAVVEVTEHDLWYRADRVVAAVRSARTRRRAA
jgi:very-short-patch-repair endonuclease